MISPRPRKTLIGIALCLFIGVFITGPMNEATLTDRLFSSTLLLSTVILLLFTTRRLAFALSVTTVLFGTILIASALKFAYLTSPLLAPDLIYFVNRDLVDVLLHYPALLTATLLVGIAIPSLLFIAYRYDHPFFLARLTPGLRITTQVLGVLSCVALLIASASPTGPFAAVFDKGMWLTMIDKSYTSDFVTSFYQTQIVIPEHSTRATPNISWTQPGTPVTTCSSESCAKNESRHPDIVAVLEESTFDPRLLQVCTFPVCKRKMFLPDARTRANGYLTVHTWGGGTWTSEFALLTGLNHLTFGNAGMYAPYNLSPRVNHSLPLALKAAGYRTIAIYPMSGNFINARNAYVSYGFDAFYEGVAYGLVWESSDNDLMQVFNQIYDREKKVAGKQPLFIFMLTMRQHGPHMDPLPTLAEPFKQPLFPMLDKWLNLNLGNYLARLVGSEQAIMHLEKKLLDSSEPSILLHFGDHQPSFDGAMYGMKKRAATNVTDSNFLTYYMLKSNFKVNEKYNYPVLDISFLASLLLDIAQVKKDDFFQANALLRERCKGFYLDCPDQALLDSYHNYIFHQISALHD